MPDYSFIQDMQKKASRTMVERYKDTLDKALKDGILTQGQYDVEIRRYEGKLDELS